MLYQNRNGILQQLPQIDYLHIIPGSFSVLHSGHMSIYNKVKNNYLRSSGNQFVTFELSKTNVDKGVITDDELNRRMQQFVGKGNIIASDAATMIEKVGRFMEYFTYEKIYIHIGFDTAERILRDHSKYFIQGINAYFVVYPRKINGELHDMYQLVNVPNNFCYGTLDNYNEISATMLRNGDI